MMPEKEKVFCEECGWRGREFEMLSAPNAFDPIETIYGCPECKSVGSLIVACDEPECWRETSCGVQTDAGYRRTCLEHAP
jgi:hypothetical protein